MVDNSLEAMKRRSFGPRQESVVPFTPANYPGDPDDTYECSSFTPGDGWTNGQIPPQMTLHPFTRPGRLALYSHHRRWINFQKSWSRIGGESTEQDAIHGESSSGESVLTGCLQTEGLTVRALVAQLCETFYKHGWATGTGGGVSIRVGGPKENRPYRVFVAPSGVMKEDIVGDDVFELDMQANVVQPPKTPNLRQSACTPLWFVVYRRIPTAMCVIHTHSMNAQLATLLDPTEKSTVLRITHLEMLKGVGNFGYDSVLEVPIIDNRPSENLLADQLEQAILKYPKCNAVLVRRHGVYVWGDSWEQAKAQCESFDYLFESAVKMKSMGLDSGVIPKAGTYHDTLEWELEESGEEKKEHEYSVKRQRITPITPSFNASGSSSNFGDLHCSLPTSIPLLPKDAKILLLDVEGATTSISFVKDVLFVFVSKNLEKYVGTLSDNQVVKYLHDLQADLSTLGNDHPSVLQVKNSHLSIDKDINTAQRALTLHVRALMAHDVKATGLKSLQGDMWESGYKSGELTGHIFSDFIPALQWCKSNSVRVCIYSSGSIHAQKLLFGHTTEGDITSYLDAHFDTTSGSKREATSYNNIASKLGVHPSQVVFVSDLEAEVEAARQAGMRAVVSVRPGNAPLSEKVKLEFPIVRSLLQLCGSN